MANKCNNAFKPWINNLLHKNRCQLKISGIAFVCATGFFSSLYSLFNSPDYATRIELDPLKRPLTSGQKGMQMGSFHICLTTTLKCLIVFEGGDLSWCYIWEKLRNLSWKSCSVIGNAPWDWSTKFHLGTLLSSKGYHSLNHGWAQANRASIVDNGRP